MEKTLTPISIGTFRQGRDERDGPAKMVRRLLVCRASGRSRPGSLILGHGLVWEPGCFVVPAKHFRRSVHDLLALIRQCLRHASMDLLSRASQKRSIRCLLDECVLERVDRTGRLPSLEDESRVHKMSELASKDLLIHPARRCEQRTRELAAKNGPPLRNRFGCAESVESCHERVAEMTNSPIGPRSRHCPSRSARSCDSIIMRVSSSRYRGTASDRPTMSSITSSGIARPGVSTSTISRAWRLVSRFRGRIVTLEEGGHGAEKSSRAVPTIISLARGLSSIIRPRSSREEGSHHCRSSTRINTVCLWLRATLHATSA